MSVGVVIQARVGSTRLPGKVLMPIGGRPLLGYILARLRRLRHPATVVVAAPDTPPNDAVAALCGEYGVACFRGSEQDVLGRYLACAEHHRFDHVVRLTADNPFPDVEALDELIALHLRERADFTISFPSLPVGVGAEIFTIEALRESARRASAPHHFEHVDEVMLENPADFRTVRLEVTGPRNRPDVRLTVDTPEDYRRACQVADHAPGGHVTTEDAIALCGRSA